MGQKKVNMRRLKEFALLKLPTDSVLRDILLGEKDGMDGYNA